MSERWKDSYDDWKTTEPDYSYEYEEEEDSEDNDYDSNEPDTWAEKEGLK